MYFTAFLGTLGLTDVGFQFFNSNETANGARITAGVLDAGDGWYSIASATIPSGAVSIRWDSTGTVDAKAREAFEHLVAVGVERGQLNVLAGVAEANLVQWLAVAPLALVSQRVQALVGAYGGGLAPPSADQITDAVWDESVGLHNIANSTGETLSEVWEQLYTGVLPTMNVNLNDVEAVTGKLDTALELDGAVYRYTANALEQAPVSGGGGTDWTSGERDQIRHRLGIDGAATAPIAVPSLAAQITAVAIKTKTDNLPPDPADASDIAASFVTVNGKLDVIDDTIDTEVPAIKTVTDKLNTTLEVDGPVWRYTINALEQAPAGGGGGGGLTAQQTRDAMLLASTPGVPAAGSIDAKLDALVPTGGGTGAFLITTTVTDGTNPLQNATIRISEGATSFALTTDSLGHATFSLDAATYTVSTSKGGFAMTPITRTVTGNQAGTLVSPIVMTPVAVPAPPGDIALCRVFGNLETPDNLPAADVEILFELVVPSAGPAKSERLISGRSLWASTNSQGQLIGPDGNLWVDLQRNDLLVPSGTTYRVTSTEIGANPKTITLNTSTFDLSSIAV